MIHEAFFANFRALRDVKIGLRPLTVIVGPNASGKTSILRGLQCLLDLIRTANRDRFFERTNHPLLLATRDSQATTRVGAKSQSGTVSFEFRIPPSVSWESLYAERDAPPDWKFSFKSTRNRETKWVEVNSDPELLLEFPEAKLLKFEPSRLASVSDPSKYRPEIHESGEGLASVLAVLHGKDYATFKKLESHLCKVVPSVRQIRFDRVPVAGLPGFPAQSQVGETLIFDTASATGIPASCISDGTLLALGLLTVLYTSKRPQLILLDDLEHGLHPKAQREIIPLMRDLLKTTPGLQIVGTTHSPYLVDVLAPEEVRLTTLTDEGAVLCRPLDEHPQFERWKEEMSPGEFWSAVGEQWVAEAVKP